MCAYNVAMPRLILAFIYGGSLIGWDFLSKVSGHIAQIDNDELLASVAQ